MYGLDRFVAPPPLSAILTVLLALGCDGLGIGVLQVFGLGREDAPRWHRWQAPIAGAMALAIVLYPLALANLTSLAFMRIAAYVVIGIGLVNGVFLARGVIHRTRDLNSLRGASRDRPWQVLLALTLMAAAVMALGPVTDADSLDYHLGVPIALLRSGEMPIAPEWFHSRIAGSNEVLNALGLAVGSEAFGASLQFAALVGIVGLLLLAESHDDLIRKEGRTRPRTIAAMAAMSAPAIVGLLSQKPQLLPIAMTTLALALIVYPSRRMLSGAAALRSHALVCLLVMSASQAKLPYMLGGGIVGLLSLGVMARRGMLGAAVAVAVVAATLVLAPPVVWKHHYFHDGFVNSLIKAVPGYWPGSDAFEKHLRTFRDSIVPFPLSLIVPSGPTTVSTIIGPAGFLLFLALRPGRDPWLWVVIAAAVAVFVGAIVLGPPTSRSFLEPYFWLLMVFALQPPHPLADARWLTWLVAMQATFTFGLLFFGAMTLFPGGLTTRWRSMVMDRSANGYGAMRWVDSVLPVDAVMITPLRSMALAPRDIVSMDWTDVVDPGSPEARPYLRRLKDRRVTHMLVFGSPPSFAGFRGCVGSMVAGPRESVSAYRNPFSGFGHDQAWVYRFNSQLLPDCVATGH